MVVYECLLNRPATFAWETHEYIKLTTKGTAKFNELIAGQDWSEVQSLAPDVDLMVSKFQEILDHFTSMSFSWKRIRRRSNDPPWLTDGIHSQIKKWLAIFRSEGRSIRWKRIDISIKKTLETRKGKYFKRESSRIKKAGRNESWYSLLSRMVHDDTPKLCMVTV